MLRLFLAALLVSSAAAAVTLGGASITSVNGSPGGSVTADAMAAEPSRTLLVELDDSVAQTGQLAIALTGTNFLALTAPITIRVVGMGATCTGATEVSSWAGTVASATSITSTSAAGAVRTRANAFASQFKLNQGGAVCVRDANNGYVEVAKLRVVWNCRNRLCNAQPLTDWSRYLTPTQVAQFQGSQEKCPLDQAAADVCECYNSASTMGCCGGRVYDRLKYKCCGASNVLVLLNTACPCTRANQNTDGTNQNCPSNEPFCCLQSKFSELVTSSDAGECYNRDVHRCCNTGMRYDPGTDQCCVVNGIQSLNVPCPCEDDAHCTGAQEGSTANAHMCCKQSSPTPREGTFCSAYSNYPSGTAPYQVQRCTGACIDPAYQLCCNGASCIKEYEKCCNSTCCNKYVGTCKEGHRAGSAGSPSNWLAFLSNPADANSTRITYNQCTTVEQMNPFRAAWVFMIPTALLVLTLLGLALVLVFANKAASRQFSFVERALVVGGVLLAILSIPLFFSPLYKYGIIVVFVALIGILTAASRDKWLNILALVALIFLFIYLLDPFHASGYFTMGYWRIFQRGDDFGRPEPQANGLWHSTNMLWPNAGSVMQHRTCTRFYYNFFELDGDLLDKDRWDNPMKSTFGYCSRGWILVLFIVAGFIILLTLLMLLLALLGLVLRFRKERLEPVELEVVAADRWD